MADIQQTADQLKARAEDLTKQAQARVESLKGQAEDQVKTARELGDFAGNTAQKSGKIISDSAEKLVKNEVKAIKGGYEAVVGQLKGFKDVKNLDGLKAILKTQAQELPKIGKKYVDNNQRGKIAKKARTDLTKVVDQVKAKFSNEPAAPVAAAKTAAKKVESAAKTTAKKAAPKKAAAKKPAARKTAAKKATAKA